ncbi:MAG: zinc-dependent alcohol dehydrogenase family protein [Cellulomonadaceae bacterium]|nr:zinc-dependent alcohol dehydrogenase family protein [Cellulomonadaceae bacterium]
MKAAIIHGGFDVRVEQVPDPVLRESTDAVVRVLLSCICGSDLWPYRNPGPRHGGPGRIGHEFLGVVEEVGVDVTTVRPGDVVIAPFMWSDGTCPLCLEGVQTSCLHGGGWGEPHVDGGQGEAVRVPQADGTLVVAPVAADDERLPALLTLSDVMGTGHHAALSAGVVPGSHVAVVGDGAVGLCGVLAARRLGAERIILLGRHDARVAVGRGFGATDVVPERGADAIARVLELTGGLGVAHVLECVGMQSSWDTAIAITRPGGTVGYVGVPAGVTDGLPLRTMFRNNVSVHGGVAPVRAYLPELMADVLSGAIDPAPVFDLELPLDQAPAGYTAMDERRAIKTLLRP